MNTQLTVQPSAQFAPAMMISASPVSRLANPETRDDARKVLVDRLYKKIPLSLACELHRRWIEGIYDVETDRLLREAIILARTQSRG